MRMLKPNQLNELLRRYDENRNYRPDDLVVAMLEHDARERGIHQSWVDLWLYQQQPPFWWDNLVFVLQMDVIATVWKKPR